MRARSSKTPVSWCGTYRSDQISASGRTIVEVFRSQLQIAGSLRTYTIVRGGRNRRRLRSVVEKHLIAKLGVSPTPAPVSVDGQAGVARRSPGCRCRARGGRGRPARAAAGRCAGRAPATGAAARRARSAARPPRAAAATGSDTCPATTGTPAPRSSPAISSRTATRAQSRWTDTCNNNNASLIYGPLHDDLALLIPGTSLHFVLKSFLNTKIN